MSNPTAHPRIAVVGVSALFPGSTSSEGFWSDILAAKDLLSDTPPTHWLPEDYYDPDPSAPDKTYAKRGGFLPNIDFDALHWGVPPSIIEATDTSQLLALIVAEQVLRDAANGQFETMDRSRISCILGVTSGQELLGTMVSRLQKPIWQKSLREHGLAEADVEAVCQRIADHYVPWQESSFPGLLGNVVAGRIANRLDLGGTNCVTDAACASTFSALSMAVRELYMGDSDLVITGGVDTLNDIFMFMCFSKTPALSMSGDCRPFSDQADGTMLGEGLGMVALKRLDDAERDGDRVYAVLSGVGSSSDGRSKSVYAPVSEGQAKALRRAYKNADFSAATVELIEAHGTGTKAGDAAEFGGLSLVFGDAVERPWCALGSVKSQVGHTKAAAGAAGLFKVVMALHHKVLPPTIKVERPNPKLGIEESAFYLNTEARPWIRGSDHPRRAGVSSFGFGGSNFHLALEEYQGSSPRPGRLRSLPVELVAISGADGAAVAAEALSLAQKSSAPGALQAIAWQCAQDFDPIAGARLALVAEDEADLASKLERLAAVIAKAPEVPFVHPDGSAFGLGAHDGDIAFIFPGQGSQYVAMGADLAMAFDRARGPWDRAADLDFGGGARIDQIVYPAPRFSDEERAADEATLRQTQWAQPAIGATSLSMLAMLDALGVRPAALAGHSFGEITALYAAGVLSERSLLEVARRRGELMAAASELPGAMSAVSAPVAKTRELLKKSGRDDVVIANHNAPNQVVISGTAIGIDAVEELLGSEDIGFKRLDVATAFHSPVVAASEAPFAEFLADISFADAETPVWSGESASPYEAEASAKKQRLARQIANPVRFVDMITGMADAGVTTFIEVGPGSVLTGLVGRTLADRAHRAIALDRSGGDGVIALSRGCAALLAAGVALDLNALWQGYDAPEALGEGKKSRLSVSICGANYAKAYPPEGGAAALPGPNPPEAVVLHRGPAPGVAPAAVIPAAPPAPAAVVAAPVPAPAAVAAPALSDSLLATWQATLEQNAITHAAFQQSMAQTHTAYLDAMQSSITALAQLAGGSMPAISTVAAPQPIAAPMAIATVAPAVIAAPMAIATAAPAVIAAPPAPTPSPLPTPSPTIDLHAIMLQVVAEKTGYPAEMLDLTMNLESDLGIDSIKRVEILSAVQDQAPGMPEVDPAAMSALETLGAIVAYMQDMMGAPTGNAVEAPPAADPAVDLHALMFEIVAEKTGYPAEMLELNMKLEGDLGIDSIKRVEILSAVQDRAPGMPEVDPAAMSALETLGAIVEYMQNIMGATATAAPATVAPPTAAAAEVDLQALMLEIVAEKTGYPAEMLELDMNLEGDLGIDSIKRVEILSAVQDRAPGIPEVDAGVMASLQTLDEIVRYFRGLSGAAEAPLEAEAPPTSAPELPAPPPLGRYALSLTPTPACGLAQPGLWGGDPVWITRCGTGLAERLAAMLRQRGVNAQPVDTLPEDAKSVVFLGGLRPVVDADEAIAVIREGFAIGRSLAPKLSENTGLFVTVQDTGGAFGMTDMPHHHAYLAGLPALVKTAAQEWPKASLKAIDFAVAGRDLDAQAQALADELLLGGGEIEVALDADGGRSCPRSTLTPVQPGVAPIGAGDVVVVSGGGRGVTAACVIEWAQHSGAKFLLLGRSVLGDEPECCAGISGDAELKSALLAAADGAPVSPAALGKQVRDLVAAREIRSTVAAIKLAGGDARYCAAGVTDPEAVAAALAQVRSDWGPIRGLVHGAGVLADRKIADQTDAQFDSVFNTKVEGLRVLLAALADDPLRLICLFSSVSARCGNNGQSSYAIANEVLNKVAAAEARARGGDVLVKSLGWGPWEGGMVNDQLKAHFARLGVPMIPLAVGVTMFTDELSGAQPDQVEVVLGGEPRPEALLVVGSEARSLRLEVAVSATTHAYLAGHRIGGEVVVPVALALEWFSRMARIFRPDLHFTGLRDLKVLKGILVSDFDGAGERLVIRCEQLDHGDDTILKLAIESADGVPYYQAQAPMAERPSTVSGELAPELPLTAWNGAPIYGDVLFHEDEFQVIVGLDGVGDEGIAGVVSGVHEAQWGWERWDTDVAAMDGGLQMVLLWARSQMGGAALPMSIGEVRIAELPPKGKIRCVARCRADSKTSGSADVVFHNESGERFAELNDVRVILRPTADA